MPGGLKPTKSLCSFMHFYYDSLAATNNQMPFASASDTHEECSALWAAACASLANWPAKLIGCMTIVYLVPSHTDRRHARWNSCDKILEGTIFHGWFFSFQDFAIILPHASVVLCCLPRILPASHLPTIRLLFLPYTQNLNFVQGGNMLIQKYFPVFFGVRNDHTTIKET